MACVSVRDKMLSLLVVLTAGLFLQVEGEDKLVYSTIEEFPKNTYVGDVADDSNVRNMFDPSDLPNLKFSILNQDEEAQYFAIEEESGVLRIAKKIDREVICPKKVTCLVRLDIIAYTSQDNFKLIKVNVTIGDQNDSVPQFLEDHITRNIPENTQPGMRISIPEADDLDSPEYGISEYRMITGSAEFEFRSIPGSDGSFDLYLELKEEVDRENKASYRIILAALDKGSNPNSGTLTIEINIADINDNHPEFTQDTYSVTVPEDLDSKSVVVRVQATDLDLGPNGEIIYGFNSKTTHDFGHLFQINNATGDITVDGAMDYEEHKVYNLGVTAHDKTEGSFPDEAKVVIHVQDVNDVAPIVSINSIGLPPGTLAVSESAGVGSLVAYISVSDPDTGSGGQFTCSLQSRTFALQEEYPTEFSLLTAADLDREVVSEYYLQFICKDQGSKRLTSTTAIVVDILDVNDKVPEFKPDSYTASIKEGSPFGTFIGQIHAEDDDEGPNGQIRYVLGVEADNYIDIDPNSGNITSKFQFDYEGDNDMSFNVLAIDQSDDPKTAIATFRILVTDENDEAPKFSLPKYTFVVKENQDVGVEVHPVGATDKDSSPYNEMTFSLYSGDTEVFSIDPNTGMIYTKLSLNRETEPGYEVVVIAKDKHDNTLSSTVSVSIIVGDMNDNTPKIYFPNENNNTLYISNRSPIGKEFTRIEAHDEDINENAELSYSITGGNQDELFIIDRSTGILSVQKDMSPIGEKTVSLRIKVTDHGSYQLSSEETLNVVVNRSLALGPDGSKLVSGQNLIIVITVAVVSGIIIVILLVAILIVRRQETQKKKKQYLTKLLHPDARTSTASSGSYDQTDFNQQQLAVKPKHGPSSMRQAGYNGDPHGYNNDVQIQDENSFEKDPSLFWQQNEQGHSASPVYPRASGRAHSPISHQHSLQLNPQYLQQRGNYPQGSPAHAPYDRKSLDNQAPHYGHPNPDTASVHSENMSNADSGRGSNEDGHSWPSSTEAEAHMAHPGGPNSPSRGANFKRRLSGIVQMQTAHAQENMASGGAPHPDRSQPGVHQSHHAPERNHSHRNSHHGQNAQPSSPSKQKAQKQKSHHQRQNSNPKPHAKRTVTYPDDSYYGNDDGNHGNQRSDRGRGQRDANVVDIDDVPFMPSHV